MLGRPARPSRPFSSLVLPAYCTAELYYSILLHIPTVCPSVTRATPGTSSVEIPLRMCNFCHHRIPPQSSAIQLQRGGDRRCPATLPECLTLPTHVLEQLVSFIVVIQGVMRSSDGDRRYARYGDRSRFVDGSWRGEPIASRSHGQG
jgi:hypothetical protein